MKDWKQRGKRILALALVLILGIQAFYGMNTPKVQATTVNADMSVEGKITNGDFESGRAGYEVRGWHLTSMQSTGEKYTGTYDYLKNFIFKTEVENGNKVAHLEKTGAGTAAMTSEAIAVTGGQTYRLSADYKMKDFSIDKDASGNEYTTNIAFRGIRFMIEQFDAAGNSLSYSKYPTSGNLIEQESAGWNTYFTEFTVLANAKTIVLYCNLGGDMRVNSTVLFDNIAIERTDDYGVVNSTFEKTTYLAQGSKAAGTAGPAGWTLERTNDGGVLTPSHNNKWENNFRATVQTVDGSKVAAVEYIKEKSTAGYVLLQSSLIPLDGVKTCNVMADCKLVCYNADGTVKTDGYLHRGINLSLACYDADGKLLGNVMGSKITNTKNSAGTGIEWKQLQNTGVQTLTGTKYVKIGLYVGYALSDSRYNRNPEGHFSVYFDNVSLDVENTLTGWTLETCGPKGVPRGDNLDFTPYYGIRKINGGVGREKALQLYVKREDGPKGGAVMYSEPIQITDDKEYTTAFDLKIENYIAEEDTNSNRIFGAVGVLRYLDNEGNQINGNKPEVCRSGKENINWTHYEYTFTPPKGAVAVQFGLVMGTNKIGICKDMEYSIDHIVILEKEAYADSQKDPAVTTSSLYKQTALFVGDSVGSALAEKATSFSQMQVTNVCDESKTLVAQLLENAGNAYDYIVISGGKKEAATNMPAGEVTADAVYMDGMDFDITKFAGGVEQAFGTITEYYGQEKIVYVLTTDNVAYRAVAQKAAEKWNVQLVMLDDITDSTANWNDIIEPAEDASVFDCYEVPFLYEYLVDEVNALVGTEISIDSDIEGLQRIKEKAQNCPDTNANYDKFQRLVESIDTNLAEFADFRPLIYGGSIDTEDPNLLYFIAVSPKNALTEDIKVKQMGVLSIPATYLDANASSYKADASLELKNQYVKDMQVTYTEAAKEFIVQQEGWEADPATEYAATAYVIYEIDNKEYIFYSNNDYKNALGNQTAEDGRVTKSVYSISKNAALQLSAVKANEMNFAAIGGADKISQIESATEDTTISLLDVYRLICNNKAILEKWLNEGGASR